MKKIIYVLLTFLLFSSLSVNASTKTYERTEANGYGVKKETDYHDKLDSIMKTKYVDASEKIYDFSDILTDSEEQELKVLIDKYREKTGFDLVIVTDNLPYTNDDDNMIYAEDFYDYNDFGLDDKHYSGIIFFRNTYESDPYYDMTLSGDAQLYYHTRIDDILDTIYDDIKGKSYLSGLKEFIHQLDGYYDRGIPSEMDDYEIDDTGHMKKKPEGPKEYKVPTFWMIISSILGTTIFTTKNIKKNKMVKHAYEADTYLEHESINYTRKNDKFVNTFVTQHRISSNSGGSSGGFSSHTGSSGFGHSSGGRHG